MTAAELSKLQRAHERAAVRYQQTGEARNAAVLIALQEGWTHQQVSDALGISRGRVAAILKAHRG